MDICGNQPALIRLMSFSYLRNCWEVGQSAVPSFSWLIRCGEPTFRATLGLGG
jgi:hypothetical protein